MGSSDKDRRAPVLSWHVLQADPLRLREGLREVHRNLAGWNLDGRTRRKAILLIAALADQWSSRVAEDRVDLEIEHTPIRLRVTATAGEGTVFWQVVGPVAAHGRADTWGVNREPSGAWFEIAMPPALSDTRLGSGPGHFESFRERPEALEAVGLVDRPGA